MTTVVLVHGTGVRKGSYAALFDRFRTALTPVRSGVEVLPCQWGEGLGASLREGTSIPAYAPVAEPERAAVAAWASSQWSLLDADPVHELRMLVVLGASAAPVPFAADTVDAAAVVTERAACLTDDATVAGLAAACELTDEFPAAVRDVLRSTVTREAMRVARLPPLAAAVARAIVATALRRSADGERGPVPVVAQRREQLVAVLVDRLGGADLAGPFTAFAKVTAVLAWRWVGAGMVERRRNAIMDGTHPAAGDILHYLARGDRIRRFIRESCLAAEPPVVVVAHSLGGIAALDLLATDVVPGVAHLVTVGSQAPFLYEIDALPSLSYGDALPPTVPAWTNVYDSRDLLSYVGGGVFPGRVTDVEVSSGNPFPFAHSDYFGNPRFYEVLGTVLDKVRT